MVVDDSRLQCAVWRKLLEERYGDKIAVETYTDPETGEEKEKILFEK